MQTYRMSIVFNDGLRPYENDYVVERSDSEMIQWIRSYAESHSKYKRFTFIEYFVRNRKTGKLFRGKIEI